MCLVGTSTIFPVTVTLASVSLTYLMDICQDQYVSMSSQCLDFLAFFFLIYLQYCINFKDNTAINQRQQDDSESNEMEQ